MSGKNEFSAKICKSIEKIKYENLATLPQMEPLVNFLVIAEYISNTRENFSFTKLKYSNFNMQLYSIHVLKLDCESVITVEIYKGFKLKEDGQILIFK